MATKNHQVGIEITADVKGQESVTDLTNRLDDAAKVLGGELKVKAQQAAAELRELSAQGAAIKTFNTLKQEAADSARALKSAENEAASFSQQIAAAGPPTAREAAELQKLQAVAGTVSARLAQQNQALSVAAVDLRRFGVASNSTQAAQQRLAAQTQVLRDRVKDLVPAYQGAATGVANSAAVQNRAHRDIKAGMGSISEQLALMQKLFVGFTGLRGLTVMARDVADTADAYNNLQSRIKLVTGEGPAFEAAFAGVTAVAQRTSSSLESTGNLFTRLAEAGKSAGLGTQAAIDQALKLTETVNQAVQLSGASAQASDAAITQLIQGLQGGVLRGDEFNSVMEQSPRLARALAEGLGTTTGELRKMAEAGQLSSETVIKALRGQADIVAGEFSKLPPTVGRAIENLSTSWTLYVGETDKAMGASSAAASAINVLSNNLSTVGGLLLDAGQAAAALAAIRLAQYFLGIGAAATTATTAVVANTVAVTAAGVAGGTAAVGVGRFAAILSSLKLFSVLGIATNFKDIGTAIGEAAARLAGYKDRTDELAAADRVSAQIAADNIAQRQRMAALTQLAIDKSFELGKAGMASIAEFDQLTKAGGSAAEAVAKIGKDFDLSTVPGIRNATAVLDKLASDGKLSAEQFAQAWGDALKGADLAVFEVQARAALAGTAREAERLGQVLDATLRESIKRTGLDFDVISGGMGKAARSAINDTDAMINGLDRLKAMGVDTAQVLVASIGKGISTADSQQAIEAVRVQIEAVRKALGNKLADGLLDQARQKAEGLGKALEDATPGIQGVKEAMRVLGVTSDQTFKDTAEKSKAAYDAMRESGTRSARELAAGFKKAAEDAIAANNGIAPSWVTAEAAARGYEVAVDSAGKATLKTIGDSKKAVDDLAGSYKNAGAAAESAADRAVSALERQNAAIERTNAAVEKAAELERKRIGVDKEGFSTGKDGNRLVIGSDIATLTGVAAFLKNAGVADDTAARKLALQFSDGKGNIPFFDNPGQRKFGADTLSVALLKAAEQFTFGPGLNGAGARTPSSIPAPTTSVNINLDGRSRTVNTDAAGASVLQEVLTQLADARGTAGAR